MTIAEHETIVQVEPMGSAAAIGGGIRNSSGHLAGAGRSGPVVLIKPGGAARNYWRDMWQYRELLAILIWRDLAVRYKQTVFGVAWALIKPLATVAVFTFVFSRVAKLPSNGAAPYALMVYAGMLPWMLVSTILGQASGSLLNNANVIGKVYFPRLIVPLSALGAPTSDALIALAIMLPMMAWFGFLPDLRVALLPVFFALAIAVCLGPSIWLAAANVRYRDFQYVIGFGLQFGMYISPVGYSSSAVPEQWRLLYSLNPAVGVIDGFRWCLLRGDPPLYTPALSVSLAVSALSLWAGIAYFRKAERNFIDLI